MEILGIQYPTTGPIDNKARIRICKNCKAILQFERNDIFVKKLNGYEINFIKCRSCGTELTVSEVQR